MMTTEESFKHKKKVIIAGVHKAGTTSLYNYLASHADIGVGTKKEIHYYTPIRYGYETAPLSEYQSEFKNTNKNILLDASPSYLYGGENLARRIRSDNSDVKIVILLRNPTKRLISFFKFLKSDFRLAKDVVFEQFLDTTVSKKDLPDTDDIFYRAFREGCYADYLKPWLDIFGNNCRVVFLEHLQEAPQTVMLDLCEWIGIDSGIYRNDDFFTVSNETRQSRYGFIFKLSVFLNRKLDNLFKRFPHIKHKLKSFYFRINGDSTKEEIAEDSIKKVDRLYINSNEQLYYLLTDRNYSNLPTWTKPANAP